jgi:uncharacterized protein YabN with tetrapyrrole methylase and pyrophosphatase domain
VRELRVELAAGKAAGGTAADADGMTGGTADPAAATRRRAELGDLLFALTNLARHLGIDPETALRGTTARFVRRFRYIEEQLAAGGRRPSDSTLAEMDLLWEEAKRRETE